MQFGENPSDEEVTAKMKCPSTRLSPNFGDITLPLTDKLNFTGDFDSDLKTIKPNPSRLPSESDKLIVYVMPHSHNDPAWLSTFEEYFRKQSSHILSNAVKKLTRYDDMTFIWSDISFLARWWNEADDVSRGQLRKLVEEGRFEIDLGGWVSPDEANPHFTALIEVFTHGHEWLNDVFNIHPTSSWSPDPFGYSCTLPYILRKSGLDNMVIMRVDARLKRFLRDHRQLQFNWQQAWHTSNNASGNNSIFTHVMPYILYTHMHTCGPNREVCSWFDFSYYGAPERVTKSNIKYLAESLYDQYLKKSQHFQHNILLHPVGCDFCFASAKEWDDHYVNFKRLFKYLNVSKSFPISVQFGTLKDYFGEIKRWEKKFFKEKKLSSSSATKIPSLVGDFYTYMDLRDAYWSGYFTSRPFSKALGRLLESYQSAAEILTSLVYMNYLMDNSYLTSEEKDSFEKIEFPRALQLISFSRENLSHFQHHDSITGTSKSHVVISYHILLRNSIASMKHLIGWAITKLLFTSAHSPNLNDATSRLYVKSFSEFLGNCAASSNSTANADDEIKEKLWKRARVNFDNFESDVEEDVNKQRRPWDTQMTDTSLLYNDLTSIFNEVFVSSRAYNSIDKYSYQAGLQAQYISSVNDHPFHIVIFNSLAQSRREMVRVRVRGKQYFQVLGPSDQIQHQVNPVWQNPCDIPMTDVFDLIFMARTPPLGISVFEVRPATDTILLNEDPHVEKAIADTTSLDQVMERFCLNHKHLANQRCLHKRQSDDESSEIIILENPHLQVSFASAKFTERTYSNFHHEPGDLLSIKCKHSGIETPINSTFGYLTSVSSGAYVLEIPDVVIGSMPEIPSIKLIEGPLMSELRVIRKFATIVYRLCNKPDLKCSKGLEIDFLLDLTSEAFGDSEATFRLQSNIQNNEGFFYTDSNGFQMIKRIFSPKLPIGGNFYPATTTVFIEDERQRLSLLLSHSAAVTSLVPGELQIILDRKTSGDDHRGAGQPLYDNVPFTARLVMLLEHKLMTSTKQPHQNAHDHDDDDHDISSTKTSRRPYKMDKDAEGNGTHKASSPGGPPKENATQQQKQHINSTATNHTLDDKVRKNYLAFPSLISHTISNYLLRPMIAMTTTSEEMADKDAIVMRQMLSYLVVADSVWEKNSYHSFIRSSLPCDTSMINLRIRSSPAILPEIESYVDYFNTTFSLQPRLSLIVHRFAFDCNFSIDSTHRMMLRYSTRADTSSLGQVNIAKLIDKTIIRSVKRTSLTLMHDESISVDPMENIILDPMQLSAYVLELKCSTC